MIKITFMILILFMSINSYAKEDKGTETGYNIPRYVSLKSDNVNLRIGPSKNYPIILKYQMMKYLIKKLNILKIS